MRLPAHEDRVLTNAATKMMTDGILLGIDLGTTVLKAGLVRARDDSASALRCGTYGGVHGGDSCLRG